MKTRRERREGVRNDGVAFEPIYNTGTRLTEKGKKITVGGSPRTHAEMFGVGYERFNNKFVEIKKVGLVKKAKKLLSKKSK